MTAEMVAYLSALQIAYIGGSINGLFYLGEEDTNVEMTATFQTPSI